MTLPTWAKFPHQAKLSGHMTQRRGGSSHYYQYAGMRDRRGHVDGMNCHWCQISRRAGQPDCIVPVTSSGMSTPLSCQTRSMWSKGDPFDVLIRAGSLWECSQETIICPDCKTLLRARQIVICYWFCRAENRSFDKSHSQQPEISLGPADKPIHNSWHPSVRAEDNNMPYIYHIIYLIHSNSLRCYKHCAGFLNFLKSSPKGRANICVCS